MKKIAFIILTMITMPSYATTMCAANDTVTVVLDPSIDSTGSVNQNYFDSATMICWAPYSYGRLEGQYACVNADTEKIVGGERYGGVCYVRITHPVLSLWVYAVNYGSAQNCNSYCGNRLRGDAILRTSLFGSITN